MTEAEPGAVAEPDLDLDRASLGQRVGAAALDLLLFAAALGIGWIVWWVALWSRGQTPGKAVLKLHIVRNADGAKPSMPRMAAHELLGKGLLPLALVTAAIAVVDRDGRSLWDHVTGLAVVRDPGAEEHTELP